MQQTKAQRQLVLGFGADKSGASRGGQARRKHGKAGAVDSDSEQLSCNSGSLAQTAQQHCKGGSHKLCSLTHYRSPVGNGVGFKISSCKPSVPATRAAGQG